MFSFTEQFSVATANAKSQLEQQLNAVNTFASTAFDGVQQVIALNLHTTQASVEKTSAAAKQLLEKDPREFFSVSAVPAPNFDSLLAYSRELYSIASKTQEGLLQAVKVQISDAAAAAKPLALAAQEAAPKVIEALSAPVAQVSAAVPPKPVAAPVADEPEAPVAPAPVPVAQTPIAAAVADTVTDKPAPKSAQFDEVVAAKSAKSRNSAKAVSEPTSAKPVKHPK
jgi:phasin family protein